MQTEFRLVCAVHKLFYFLHFQIWGVQPTAGGDEVSKGLLIVIAVFPSVFSCNFFNYYHFINNRNLFTNTLGEEDDSYTDSDEIISRTRFPESWLWLDIKLPSCPPQLLNWWGNRNVHIKEIMSSHNSFVTETDDTFLCFSDTTSSVKHVPLSDSITTWQFIGISLSRTHGEDSDSLHDLTFLSFDSLMVYRSLLWPVMFF